MSVIDWHEAWSVTTDPAHIIAELVFTLVFDGLIIGLGWKFGLKRWLDNRLKREHEALDAEHGIEYHEPGHEQWREPEVTDPAYGIRDPGLAEDVRRAYARDEQEPVEPPKPKADPLSVHCPYCGQPPGKGCADIALEVGEVHYSRTLRGQWVGPNL